VAAAPPAKAVVPEVVIPHLSKPIATPNRRVAKHSRNSENRRHGSAHKVAGKHQLANTTDPLGGLNL
jgi:hypothetical protein